MSKIKESDIPRLIELYNSGLSLINVGKHFNCCNETVRATLINNNVKCRKPWAFARKHFFNFDFFEKIDSYDKAQILGLIAADGNISTKGNVVNISLIEKDKDYLTEVKNKIGYLEDLLFLTLEPPNKNAYRLQLWSEKMKKDLCALGIYPAKSLILKFPNHTQVPKEFIRSYILGYFEGDGGIHRKKDGSYSVSICGTLNSCNSIKEILIKEVSLNSCICKCGRSKSNTYTLNIGGNYNVLIFFEWLYKDSTFQMKRKYDLYLNLKEQYRLSIKHNIIDNGKQTNSKLPLKEILKIKEITKTDIKIKDLAKEYNVKASYISSIKSGKIWKQLTNESLEYYEDLLLRKQKNK